MSERISEAEQALMEVLWTSAPLSAADVAARTDPSRGWSLQTVKTMLSRVVAKGALAHEEDGRLTPLVAHLAERNLLDSKDIAEIEALLKELKP